jgi:cold shock CspA family protein
MTQHSTSISDHCRNSRHHSNGQRGYGWITSDAPVTDVPDRELFCHASGLPKGVRALSAGDRVEFTTRKSRAVGKPPEARVIKIIEAAAEAA